MMCWLLGLSSPQIGALKAKPSLVSDLVKAAEDAAHRAAVEDAMKRLSPEERKRVEAVRAQLQAGTDDKEVADARERVGMLGPYERAIRLEKSWHMLHYLLTGHVSPSNAPGDLLLTGEDLGEDVGYGPARLHSPVATREFGQFLATQDLARLQARVDLNKIVGLGLYGMPVGLAPIRADYENELRADVARYFPLLRDYVRTMSDKGNGLLIWVS
jgi:hypothetical protein